MIEMPSGVALLAMIAGILFLYVLTWGAVSNAAFWPRLIVRMVATIILILLPLSYVAMTEIESRGEAGGALDARPHGFTASAFTPRGARPIQAWPSRIEFPA